MFLKQVLGMRGDVKALFLKDQLALLKDIVKAYLIRIPFQNVTNMGQLRPVDRGRVNMRDFAVANFTGVGGLCGHNNVFMKYMLETIGYDVDILSGTVLRSKVPGAHIVTLVRIPPHKIGRGKEKRYIVDVGCATAIHEPILLDELPYQGRAGGLNYRYQWMDGMQKTMQRINEAGDAIGGPKPSDFINPMNNEIHMSPSNIPYVKQRLDLIFLDPFSHPVHQTLFAFRYLSIGKNDFEGVCIAGTKVIKFTKETRTVENYESYSNMGPVVKQYFPMFSKASIDTALSMFAIPFEEALKLPSLLSPSHSK